MICKLCDFGVTLPLDENGVFDKDKAKRAVYFGKHLNTYLLVAMHLRAHNLILCGSSRGHSRTLNFQITTVQSFIVRVRRRNKILLLFF